MVHLNNSATGCRIYRRTSSTVESLRISPQEEEDEDEEEDHEEDEGGGGGGH